MLIRLTLFILIACTACEPGLIPCPSFKATKAKRYKKPLSSYFKNLTARADDSKAQRSKNVKPIEERQVKTVSMEEWDCPKPGEKKSISRSVKGNIRKNLKKVKDAEKEQPSLISKQ